MSAERLDSSDFGYPELGSQLPSSAFGVMKMLPDKKTEIENFSRQLVNAVQSGEVNPLQLKAIFKSMEAVCEKVEKEIKESILREAGKYPGTTFNAYGFEIQKAENGVKYDYAACGDPIYEQRQSALNAAKTLVDERTAFLRTLKEPLTVVDDESGEVATIQPPVKKGTEGLKFFLK